MKIITVLGTRPEIIRLSRIIELLDRHCDHVLVHTGQNFDRRLSDIFFEELRIRKPNHYLGVRGETAMDQVAQILTQCESLFLREAPDRILLLGDTNSALSAFAAKRLGIPVFHMEAGNRCYDDRVPEEINRRIIDHSSDYLMPYTERSRSNLLREGFPGHRIFVTGNPILEVINSYQAEIDSSKILPDLALTRGGYFLVTLHRAENVDVEGRLRNFAKAFEMISDRHRCPVIVSTHPRTAARIRKFGIKVGQGDIRFTEPFGFFDFITLEKNAAVVLSDSGTAVEECAILGVPSVTLRDVTERPETIECGSNILGGADPEVIARCVDTVMNLGRGWTAPAEYLVPNVSETAVRIVTSFHLSNLARL